MVERYSHVMHICSNVTGRLAPGLSAFDALRACLPAGTLSGAPKVRAMEIIDELEPHRRGPYGGAVGYVDFSGNMDTCIALRTLVLKGQTAYLQAGAGGGVRRPRHNRRLAAKRPDRVSGNPFDGTLAEDGLRSRRRVGRGTRRQQDGGRGQRQVVRLVRRGLLLLGATLDAGLDDDV